MSDLDVEKVVYEYIKEIVKRLDGLDSEVLNERKEKHSLRRDHNTLENQVNLLSNDIKVIIRDSKDMRKVVNANTEAMKEIHTVLNTIVKGGKLFAWLLGIVGAVLGIYKVGVG
ncbi:MAG: hypothetical protein Unbinned5081contig1002_40 [Prokaryotic dsDNA virus sp.]|nr:MAG: hypothetical protein Unbinned5081contig1002_40 [Prokaryotic dsDNA virus sp.]